MHITYNTDLLLPLLLPKVASSCRKAHFPELFDCPKVFTHMLPDGSVYSLHVKDNLAWFMLDGDVLEEISGEAFPKLLLFVKDILTPTDTDTVEDTGITQQEWGNLAGKVLAEYPGVFWSVLNTFRLIDHDIEHVLDLVRVDDDVWLIDDCQEMTPFGSVPSLRAMFHVLAHSHDKNNTHVHIYIPSNELHIECSTATAARLEAWLSK